MIRLFSLLWLLFGHFTLSAQLFPHLLAAHRYDNKGPDRAAQLLIAPDGQLMVGGYTITGVDEVGGCGDIWIFKVDTLGDLLWEQEIGIEGCEVLSGLQNAHDGGWAFAGVTGSLIDHRERGDETYFADYLFGKLDFKGNLQYLRSYGGSRSDLGRALVAGNQGDYLLAGITQSSDGDVEEHIGATDIWLLRTDENGEILIKRVYGGKDADLVNKVALFENEDLLLVGSTHSPLESDEAAHPLGCGLVMRLEPTGRLRWQKRICRQRSVSFSDLAELPDGRLLIAGQVTTLDGDSDFFWMELDQQGNTIREVQLPGPNHEALTAITVCKDGGFLFGGYSQSLGQTAPYLREGDDFWLLRYDYRNRLLWKQTFGGTGNERCVDVLEYRPGLFYALGEQVLPEGTSAISVDRDLLLIQVTELPADSIQPGIFVRAEDYQIASGKPTRFRARFRYGDRFLWDFGDGTRSEEEQPLKTYKLPGTYQVRLTVFANENCQQTIELSEPLEVW